MLTEARNVHRTIAKLAAAVAQYMEDRAHADASHASAVVADTREVLRLVPCMQDSVGIFEAAQEQHLQNYGYAAYLMYPEVMLLPTGEWRERLHDIQEGLLALQAKFNRHLV